MEENIKIGDIYEIHCYKHNGKIHRTWNEATILDVTDDFIVCGNYKTKVTESNGTTHKTKEPAIMYYFKDKWYNVIAQMKKEGVSYYCNIATPFIIEEGTVKYIDYDLDLRIYPTGEYKILDKLEYQYHKKIMNYSDDLDKAIKNGLEELIDLYKSGSIIFNEEANKNYEKLYESIKKRNI